MPGRLGRSNRSGLRWLFVGLAVLWVAGGLCACVLGRPNQLAGKWQGEHPITGKQVYWEFMPDGRLFTNNFTAQEQFRYRIKQPNLLYISFFGQFEQDAAPDELVYHFSIDEKGLHLSAGNQKMVCTKVAGE